MMISVIMPAYNAASTIAESIKSALAQTYNAFELIIVDDCSKDNTEDIILEFMNLDSRIKFFKNERNLGVAKTRNFAIGKAQGDWIAFLDSDDIWNPLKLEKQMNLVKNNTEAVICYTASAFTDHRGNKYGYILPALERITYKELLRKNLLSCSSVLIRTDIMKTIEMPNDSMHEDYYVWLCVLRQYEFAYGINEPLLTYRLSHTSKSSNRIKSAIMIFNTYCAVGFCKVHALVLVVIYLFYSINKRRKIYKSVI